VLDIGCGVGIPGRLVLENKKNCEIWGVDISDDIIEANKKEVPEGKWLHGYVGSIDVPDNYFDVVFSGEVLEHIDTPSDLLNDAYKALKKGGKFVLTTPREDGVESSEHVWYFTVEDVENLYLNAGFKSVKFVDLPDMEHLMIIYAVGKK